uniref:HECT-type E3 ubiquitin transferase n=1 Tax=Globisporangium ultimum (strain ATCC 200006 / CBS 805.95 / DAOM BR144) TaxID=431595 RepID=K3X4R1_GLOUD
MATPSPSAAGGSALPTDAEQFKTLFHAKYLELVACGVAPNDAAAQALQELHHLMPPPVPVNGNAHAPAAASATASAQHTADQQQKPDEGSVTLKQNGDTDDDVHMEESHTDEEDASMQYAAEKQVDAEEQSGNQPHEARNGVAQTMAGTPIPETVLHAGTAFGSTSSAQETKRTRPPLGILLKQALEVASTSSDYREVKKLVYQTFSDLDVLNQAFVTANTASSMEDTDSSSKWWYVDHALLVEVYGLLNTAMIASSDQMAIQNTMRNALETLVTQPWNVCSTWTKPESLRFFLILFEHPSLFDPDYLNVVGGLCKLFYHASSTAKTLLREHWSAYFSNDELYRLLQILQQAITVCLYGSKKMDIVYACCSVLKELHTINDERDESFATYKEFYNDAVNSEVDIIEDYARSIIFMKKRHAISRLSREPLVVPSRMLSELSFCDYPFVLDAGSKSRILQVDSDLEQRARAQEAALAGPMMGIASQYLILKVRRENIIEDSLQQLVRLTAETLKKPLKVKFIGEEGVDEGGVQKEYFQILIRQLLDPAFGMFNYDEETRQLWFNSDSLESTMEFELIGILLGIAIYNAVILDVHFPHIVYKKLMECQMGLEDVEIAMPALGKGLRQLLEFQGNVEEVFQRNFEYSYEVFGEVKTVELKPGGSSIPVTNANREEYVALYVDHILNKSAARQYEAFHRGFHLVCNGEVLQMLRWEELHLTICGSPDLDFEALEEVTHYEDGFTEDSECIKQFSLEEKKKLLMFSTGSDRVPIRGLSNMIFVISRNGSDPNRLPSAHTW